MSAARLYTPQVLAAAVDLGRFPLSGDLPLRGDARSSSCGSTLQLRLAIEDGRIERVGIQASACAIGQASAAVFARGAPGMTGDAILKARDDLRDWLSGTGEKPDWPELDLIAPARDYPGRHGAIMLAWNAAAKALAAGG